MPYPVTSAGVVHGLTNLTGKQEDLEGIKDNILPFSSGQVPWPGSCKKPKVRLEEEETSQGCKVEKENKTKPNLVFGGCLLFLERGRNETREKIQSSSKLVEFR